MKVLLCLVLAVTVLSPGDVAGKFTAASPICPGDTFTFTCTVTGDMSGETTWSVGGSSECILVHIFTSSSICGPSDVFTATPGIGFGTSATSFTSTLSGTATSAVNGTLVECFGPAKNVDPGNRVGGDTLQILVPPSVNLSCVGLSEDVSGTVNVNVSWALSGGDSADFYLINITSNAPQTPYGGFQNTTTGSVTQYELTGFMARYEYNITVHGVNCGSQEGRESEPLTITPQDPAVPGSCNITLLYDQSSMQLQFIDSTWDLMPDSVNQMEACQGPRGRIVQYKISFHTGPFMDTKNVSISECTAGRCSHTFELPSNPPSSYDNVSVAAENVVGVGAARTCTAQTINCSLIQLWDLSAAGTTFLPDVSFLDGAADQYPSCDDGSVGSAVLMNTILNTATVAYYTGTTPDSRACFVCDEDSGYELNPAINERLCQRDATWSGISTICVCKLLYLLWWHIALIVFGVAFLGVSAVVVVIGVLLSTTSVICKWKNENTCCKICLAVTGVIELIVIILWIIGGVVVAYPPNGNVCDPNWHRDGLIISDFVFSTIVLILAIILLITHKKMWSKHKRNQRIQKEMLRMQKEKGTQLYTAASQGSLPNVTTLVEDRADINFQHKAGRTPLHAAAEGGHVDTVKYLVTKGAGIDTQDEFKMTPLHLAANRGRLATVQYLVGEGAVIYIRDDNGRVPLHVAAREGYVNTMKLLEGPDITINIQDKDGWTPLHMAVEGSHQDTVDYLIREKGADISIKDGKGRTPLHVAAERGRVETVKYLVNFNGANNVNIKDSKGQTPLHIAAKEDSLKTVQFLVDKGALVNEKDQEEYTPLHMAAEGGHIDIVEYLVGQGADISITTNGSNRTPECVASEGGHLDIAAYLHKSEVALYSAAGQNRGNQVTALLPQRPAQRPDINFKVDGMTALHIAARKGHANIVQILFENHADIDIQDADGKTPQDVARDCGHVNIAGVLGRASTQRQRRQN